MENSHPLGSALEDHGSQERRRYVLDLGVNQRFSLRLTEADYLVTTFDNGVNNHLNILRIGAGVAIHFGNRSRLRNTFRQ